MHGEDHSIWNFLLFSLHAPPGPLVYASQQSIKMMGGGYWEVFSKDKHNILMNIFVEVFSLKDFILWTQYSYINSFELQDIMFDM
jgi:hypothetical protein